MSHPYTFNLDVSGVMWRHHIPPGLPQIGADIAHNGVHFLAAHVTFDNMARGCT